MLQFSGPSSCYFTNTIQATLVLLTHFQANMVRKSLYFIWCIKTFTSSLFSISFHWCFDVKSSVVILISGKERTPPSTIIECPSASAVITEPDSGQQSQITMRHATGSFVLTKKPLQEESGAVNHGIDYNIRNHKPNTVFLLSETKEVGDKSHTVEGVSVTSTVT